MRGINTHALSDVWVGCYHHRRCCCYTLPHTSTHALDVNNHLRTLLSIASIMLWCWVFDKNDEKVSIKHQAIASTRKASKNERAETRQQTTAYYKDSGVCSSSGVTYAKRQNQLTAEYCWCRRCAYTFRCIFILVFDFSLIKCYKIHSKNSLLYFNSTCSQIYLIPPAKLTFQCVSERGRLFIDDAAWRVCKQSELYIYPF